MSQRVLVLIVGFSDQIATEMACVLVDHLQSQSPEYQVHVRHQTDLGGQSPHIQITVPSSWTGEQKSELHKKLIDHLTIGNETVIVFE